MLISRPMTMLITNLVKTVNCSEVTRGEIQINTDGGVKNLPSVHKKGERSTSHFKFSIQRNWESLPQIVSYRWLVRSHPYITQGSSKLDTQMVVRVRSLHPDQGQWQAVISWEGWVRGETYVLGENRF